MDNTETVTKLTNVQMLLIIENLLNALEWRGSWTPEEGKIQVGLKQALHVLRELDDVKSAFRK